MRTFNLTESSPRPGCHAIHVMGELDMAVASQLQEALDRVTADHTRVLVDLESCEFIDSTGIAVIVQARQRLAEEGRQVVVCAPSAQVQRVLEVTGLTKNGRRLVFDSSEDALAD